MKNQETCTTYSAEESRVLIRSTPEAYIKRPLYGGDAQGYLLLSLVAHAIDELHEEGSNIAIRVDKRSQIQVRDDGPGLAIEESIGATPLLEIMLTCLSNNSMNKEKAARGSISSALMDPQTRGTNLAPLAVINHVSEMFRVEVNRGGCAYRQTYYMGAPTSELEVIGPTTQTGTTITIQPDLALFRPNYLPDANIIENLKIWAVMFPKLSFTYHNEQTNHDSQIMYPEGSVSYLKALTQDRGVIRSGVFIYSFQNHTTTVDVALQFCRDRNTRIIDFVNGNTTNSGGVHINALLRSFSTMIEKFVTPIAPRATMQIKDRLLGSCIEGLTAVLCIQSSLCQWEGGAGQFAGGNELQDLLEPLFAEALTQWFFQPGQELLRTELTNNLQRMIE